MNMRAARLDLLAGFNEIDGVTAVLVNAGGNGKNVGIENDIFWRKTNASQQLVGAFAYFDLAILCIRLPRFIKCHDDDCSAVGHDFPRLIQESVLTLLHADRSEEHTSELQSLMRISYAVFCLKNKN